MALPKKRISSTRGKKRRAHWKAELPTLTRCQNCNNFVLTHSVCKNCGFYRGKQVIEIKVKGEEDKK